MANKAEAMGEGMTAERLAEHKQWAIETDKDRVGAVAELIAEVDRLRAENARLAAGLIAVFEQSDRRVHDDMPKWAQIAWEVSCGSTAALEAYVAGKVGERDAEIRQLNLDLVETARQVEFERASHQRMAKLQGDIIREKDRQLEEVGMENACLIGRERTVAEHGRILMEEHDAQLEAQSRTLDAVVKAAKNMRELLLRHGIAKETSPVIAAFDAAVDAVKGKVG